MPGKHPPKDGAADDRCGHCDPMPSADASKVEREVGDFRAQMAPFGSMDVETAVTAAIEGGHDGDWAAEQVKQFAEDTGTSIGDVDPVGVVYDALFQEARNDIIEATGKDVVNDTEEQVEVSANYSATGFDYSDGAASEFHAIVRSIPPEDRTTAVRWVDAQVG